MTNTNELTAKLKAAAQDEIMCREACDTSDLWQDEASPENVLALTEALEAAEKLIDTLRQDKDKVIDMSIERVNKLLSRAEAAEKRIAELEARTLTVKLPSLKQTESGERYVWSDGVYNYQQDVVEALAAAGISMKIEGE